MMVFDVSIYWKNNRPKTEFKNVKEAETHSPSGLFWFQGVDGEKVFVNLSEVLVILCSPKRGLSETDVSSSMTNFF